MARKKTNLKGGRVLVRHVSLIKDDSGIRRAGIIPYRKDFTGLSFCLGIDGPSSQLTDLGGGVKRLEDKTAIRAAYREMLEESLGTISSTDHFLHSSLAVYNNNMMIVFLLVKGEPEEYEREFNKSKALTKGVMEVSSLIWLSEEEFRDKIGRTHVEEKGELYEPVHHLLSKAGNFYDKL